MFVENRDLLYDPEFRARVESDGLWRILQH